MKIEETSEYIVFKVKENKDIFFCYKNGSCQKDEKLSCGDNICIKNTKKIILDCSNLTLLDSMSVSIILHYKDRFVLCNLNDRTLSILNVLGIINYVNIRDTVNDAIKFVLSTL